MRMPLLAATDSFRAWLTGLGLAVLIWVLLFVPRGVGLFLVPLGFAALAIYSLAVRPRAFAASGVLLGTTPFLAWGVIDGLQKCARFNRGGPGGGCEADPTAQVAIAVAVYALALLVTAAAAWQARMRL